VRLANWAISDTARSSSRSSRTVRKLARRCGRAKQWAVLGATDFFTVEVWTAVGLVRYHVLFVLHLATRQVQIAGIIPEPHGRWMEQMV
jgi:hypothetical protein